MRRYSEVRVVYSVHSLVIIEKPEGREARVSLTATADGIRPEAEGGGRRRLNDLPGGGGGTDYELLLRKDDKENWLIYRVSRLKPNP